MDFSRSHTLEESIATKSNIRYIPPSEGKNDETQETSLDDELIEAANQAAKDILVGPMKNADPKKIDASLFPERVTPRLGTIQPHDLVVIFESFDNLTFVYATPKEIFNNRNGHFHHDDFIGKPFGCKIRSRNNRGYGFVYLLKPTPELWARSLNHRTQIVHELDASMIVFYLNLRPNMTVCESGTGSGAMSHAIMRTIAPHGKLHTYEFNKLRAETARKEFAKNGLSHLVEVNHRDVCGKGIATGDNEDQDDQKPKNTDGGFGLPGQSVSAIFLDLPEPWLAIPHAAYTLKPNGRLASYSPCIEQTQRAVEALQEAGFHSVKTMEFRIRENYVDEVEYELPPKEKRPRVEPNPYLVGTRAGKSDEDTCGEDTGAEADNEKSELSETEGDQLSFATAGTAEEIAMIDATAAKTAATPPPEVAAPSPVVKNASKSTSESNKNPKEKDINGGKRKKMLVARPFVTMRGHTAFLTFATAGNALQPDPTKKVGV